MLVHPLPEDSVRLSGQTQQSGQGGIAVHKGNQRSQMQKPSELLRPFESLRRADLSAVSGSESVNLVFLLLLEFRQKQVRAGLVQFVLFAEVEREFPRLLEGQLQPVEVGAERALTIKDDVLRDGLADAHRGFGLLSFCLLVLVWDLGRHLLEEPDQSRLFFFAFSFFGLFLLFL